MPKVPEGYEPVDRPADPSPEDEYQRIRSLAIMAARNNDIETAQILAEHAKATRAEKGSFELGHRYHSTHRENPTADAFAQGALFGFGDELTEAGAAALHGEDAGKRARARFDASMANYRRSDPVKAFGAELAGGMASGGAVGGAAGQGARALGAGRTLSHVAAGAVPGMLQGMGGADSDDLLGGALRGGAIGGAVGAAAPWLADKAAGALRAARLPGNAAAAQLDDAAVAGRDIVRRELSPIVTPDARSHAAASFTGDQLQVYRRSVIAGLEEAIEDGLIDASEDGAKTVRRVVRGAFGDSKQGADVAKSLIRAAEAGGEGRFALAHAAARKEQNMAMSVLSGARAFQQGGVPVPPRPGMSPSTLGPLAGAAGAGMSTPAPGVHPLTLHLLQGKR